ncbi:MAG: zinc ribbon domain-containing protein [Christensenellales bacterium]|jgi:hypothetical protein
MNMPNKNIYSLIAAALGFIGFFFAFLSISAYGFGYSLSGFQTAFMFDGSSLIVFFAFLAVIAGIVLTFMRMDFFSGIAYFAAALLILIFRISMPVGGFGIWWCIIFFIAAGVLIAYGDRLPLPALNVEQIREKAAASFKNAQQGQDSAEGAQTEGPQPGASFCTNCGAKLDADVRFCPSCGAKR